MVGVTSPLYRRSRSAGNRFVAGYAIGLLGGGTLVAMLAFSVGSALRAAVPQQWRLVLLVLVLAGLGVLDLLNRTPHMMRQVPQSYAHTLAPGWRGLIWGFDLALLFTSQKTTSLVWGALAAVVLLEPGFAVLLVAVMVAAFVTQLLIGVVLDHLPDGRFIGYERIVVRWARVAAGVGLLCTGLLLTPW
jgi:hypothetical protein